MSIQTWAVPAVGRQVNAAGTFFRYESAGTEGPDQSMRVRADGNDLGSYLPGDAIELPYQCSTWDIVPAQCSAVIKVGLGRITTIRSTLVGNVTTSVRGLALSNAAKTVTSGSGSLVAANPSRGYLCIQNKDAAGSIWVTFGGGSATQANGLLIGPGGFWEWDGAGAIPTGQATAIGDLASNANVLVLEG
jgi:hypothetical protein